MDCYEVKDLLSSYYDDELSSDIRVAVTEHLASCDECSAELAGFGDLSAMAKCLSDPVPPAHIWHRLEKHLEDASSHKSRHREFPAWLNWTREPIGRFVLVTAAVVLIAAGWFGYAARNDDHGKHQMAAVFGQYLNQFRLDPHAAQEILLTNYAGRAVDADQAIHTLGYRPLVANEMPAGYSIVSTYVMKMPCCTCVQCLCTRSDGTTIAIFEHDEEEPEWFGDRPETETVCNGKRCSLVELDDRLAATWRRGNRYITIVGVRDESELNQLVAWFDDKRRPAPG